MFVDTSFFVALLDPRDKNHARAVGAFEEPSEHGVDFHEAATTLEDALSATYPDPEHSVSERRYLTIGMSGRGRVLVVAHADRGATVRIISARPATPRERRFYEEDR
ncbi:MAG: BrnT family toxin [Planctomycetota bacterium]|nr:MAG: BrnT family toxin [Planctomycetota bacterium]